MVTDQPADLGRFPELAPLPELRKMPGRFYPINYFFIEITNACNFKCTWCPDDIMGRKRGFMKKQKAFAILDEIGLPTEFQEIAPGSAASFDGDLRSLDDELQHSTATVTVSAADPMIAVRPKR